MFKNSGNKLYGHKILFLSKLILVMALAYVVIVAVLPPGEINNGQGGNSTYSKDSKRGIKATGSQGLSPADYAQIAKKNPFSGSSQLIDPANRFGRSVSDQLGLTLLGTVSGSPSIARAIIKDTKTNISALYKIGQMAGNARIEAIEANVVILIHDHQRKMLRISTWQSNSNDNAYVSQPPTDTRITRLAKNDLSVKRSAAKFQSRTQQIEKILAKTVIEPYVVDGQTEGLKITGLENIPLAKKVGLKNGDVIRKVNGHQLASKQKAYQIFKKARTQKAITLELLRADKHKKLSFALR